MNNASVYRTSHLSCKQKKQLRHHTIDNVARCLFIDTRNNPDHDLNFRVALAVSSALIKKTKVSLEDERRSILRRQCRRSTSFCTIRTTRNKYDHMKYTIASCFRRSALLHPAKQHHHAK